MITAITIDTLTKFFLWKEIEHLGENGLALVHSGTPFESISVKKTMKPDLRQIQIDPLGFRQYLIYIHIVNSYFEDLNRTLVIEYICLTPRIT